MLHIHIYRLYILCNINGLTWKTHNFSLEKRWQRKIVEPPWRQRSNQCIFILRNNSNENEISFVPVHVGENIFFYELFTYHWYIINKFNIRSPLENYRIFCYGCKQFIEVSNGGLASLSICLTYNRGQNNETNDKFYRKVAFLMYTEMVNFRPQSWKAASKLKPHRGLKS